MELLTEEIRKQLLGNAAFEERGGDLLDLKPVVKLFTPDAAGTWLLVSLHEHEIAFGLCDLGLGFPEVGDVSLDELRRLRGKLGLPVERDLYFKAKKTLKEYAEEAEKKGGIS